MSKNKFLGILLLVLAFTLSACGMRVIKGSGDLISETRQVSNFDSIELSGVGEVIITQDGSETLKIETDDNVMKYVKVEVEGKTLKLGFEPGTNIIDPSRLVFYVTVDDLGSVDVSGSGNVEADKLETDTLDVNVSGSGDVLIDSLSASKANVDISGSGKVYLTGEVGSQTVAISGSGKYLAGEICTKSIRVSVSGSGNATVCATETLNADISGSGTINYYGQPSINSSISGSGKLNNLGSK